MPDMDWQGMERGIMANGFGWEMEEKALFEFDSDEWPLFEFRWDLAVGEG